MSGAPRSSFNCEFSQITTEFGVGDENLICFKQAALTWQVSECIINTISCISLKCLLYNRRIYIFFLSFVIQSCIKHSVWLLQSRFIRQCNTDWLSGILVDNMTNFASF